MKLPAKTDEMNEMLQVAYSLYLFLGPWFAVSFVKGEPPGLCFLGATLYFQDGRLHWVHIVDPAIAIVIHCCTCLLPLTLLFAITCTRYTIPPVLCPFSQCSAYTMVFMEGVMRPLVCKHTKVVGRLLRRACITTMQRCPVKLIP